MLSRIAAREEMYPVVELDFMVMVVVYILVGNVGG
jgi:hypothetical protein